MACACPPCQALQPLRVATACMWCTVWDHRGRWPLVAAGGTSSQQLGWEGLPHLRPSPRGWSGRTQPWANMLLSLVGLVGKQRPAEQSAGSPGEVGALPRPAWDGGPSPALAGADSAGARDLTALTPACPGRGPAGPGSEHTLMGVGPRAPTLERQRPSGRQCLGTAGGPSAPARAHAPSWSLLFQTPQKQTSGRLADPWPGAVRGGWTLGTVLEGGLWPPGAVWDSTCLWQMDTSLQQRMNAHNSDKTTANMSGAPRRATVQNPLKIYFPNFTYFCSFF